MASIVTADQIAPIRKNMKFSLLGIDIPFTVTFQDAGLTEKVYQKPVLDNQVDRIIFWENDLLSVIVDHSPETIFMDRYIFFIQALYPVIVLVIQVEPIQVSDSPALLVHGGIFQKKPIS